MHLKVIACGVFEPELRELAKQVENTVELHFLDAGLHETPDKLRASVQEAIDTASGANFDAVMIAYGLCGRGTSGIVARDIPVALLRVHDCITLFLGSRESYMEQFRRHPGTFYITPGWYEKKVKPTPHQAAGDENWDKLSDDPRYEQWLQQFGADEARFLWQFYNSWQRTYTRAAYISTTENPPEDYEHYTRRLASAMGWEYECITGDVAILRQALQGNWDDEMILVLQPGQRSATTSDNRLLVAVDPATVQLPATPPSGATAHCLRGPADDIIALGIDAGGTYTDAVVYDFASDTVLAKAKGLTTPRDLIVGIRDALSRLGPIPEKQISMVALSTTLATNSIVEERGGRPGVIVMSPFDLPEGAVKWPFVRHVRGALTIGGRETEKPDTAEVRKAIHELLADGIDALVVSGYASVRNPAHEDFVRTIAEQLCNLPVICGHHLSTELDYITRANTAILNGRLLSVIDHLIGAVKASLAELGISSPLMVVKGDGSLVNEAVARMRPVETILSGPAASVVGARFLTGIQHGLVIDMGGTTTDVARVSGGMPEIHPQGAAINGWRTCVKAADIVTVGLGGDSHINFTPDRKLTIGPRRAIPLCFLATADKNARDQLMQLDTLAIPDHTTAAGLDFFVALATPDDVIGIADRDIRTLEKLQDGALSRAVLARRLGLQSPQLLRTAELEAAGYIIRSGLTPTDILHMTGEFTRWDTEAAQAAINIFAELYGEDPQSIIGRIREEIVRKLTMLVITSSCKLPVHNDDTCDPLCRMLLNCALDITDGPINVDIQYPDTIVAIGAPVKPFFPDVGQKLSTQVTIPEHAEVANALGAIASEIIATETVVVRPGEMGNYVVHSRDDRTEHVEIDEAITFAESTAARIASAQAQQAGAGTPRTSTEIDRREVRIADGSVQLVEVHVHATAAGRPTLTTPKLSV